MEGRYSADRATEAKVNREQPVETQSKAFGQKKITP